MCFNISVPYSVHTHTHAALPRLRFLSSLSHPFLIKCAAALFVIHLHEIGQGEVSDGGLGGGGFVLINPSDTVTTKTNPAYERHKHKHTNYCRLLQRELKPEKPQDTRSTRRAERLSASELRESSEILDMFKLYDKRCWNVSHREEEDPVTQFGLNGRNPGPHLPCVKSSGWWWNGVGNAAMACTGPINSSSALFSTPQPEYCWWPRSSLTGHNLPIF